MTIVIWTELSILICFSRKILHATESFLAMVSQAKRQWCSGAVRMSKKYFFLKNSLQGKNLPSFNWHTHKTIIQKSKSSETKLPPFMKVATKYKYIYMGVNRYILRLEL